ncbi:MAG: type II secretion system protein [Fibrobacter sp.]|nr:type II secretion system protein [Fibrobacter sp.]
MKGELKPNHKRGFGIVEVLIAAAVLGFLYVAVLNLQSGNHDALLRIRGRDGATEVAQNLIDSLGALGVGSLTDSHLSACDDDADVYCPCEPGLTLPSKILVSRTWKGQPGVVDHDMKVEYTATVTVSPDAEYESQNSTMLNSATHVYAKRIDVKVCWHFKNATPSIKVSGVIR